MSQLTHYSGGGSGAYAPSLPARVTREIERQGHHGVVAAAKARHAAIATLFGTTERTGEANPAAGRKMPKQSEQSLDPSRESSRVG
jgi:hypothetical protein